jgi:hypothetical protein
LFLELDLSKNKETHPALIADFKEQLRKESVKSENPDNAPKKGFFNRFLLSPGFVIFCASCVTAQNYQ